MNFFNQFFNNNSSNNDNHNINNTKYYDILGIPPTASQSEIKKAYHKQVKIKHPDKGGSVKEFQELQSAYETLSDPLKRKFYDQYGEEALKDNIQNGYSFENSNNNFYDIFNKKRTIIKKTKSIFKSISVNIREIYSGVQKHVEIKLNRLCIKCKGNGDNDPNLNTTCLNCNGLGFITIIQGRIEIKRNCTNCNGMGYIIKNKCSECDGKRITNQIKEFILNIEKGMPSGKQFVFEKESDEFPGFEPGDIIIEVNIEKKDNDFMRFGADLIYKMDINFKECICGFNKVIKHINGKKIRIKSKEGELINPNEKKIIKGLGLPFYKNDEKYGNLIINFNVIYPIDELNDNQKNLIIKLFPNLIQDVSNIENIKKYTTIENNNNNI